LALLQDKQKLFLFAAVLTFFFKFKFKIEAYQTAVTVSSAERRGSPDWDFRGKFKYVKKRPTTVIIYTGLLFLHCKKRLAIFLSPAGMSLTKLSLGGKN
jgi:hypothetical protein